MYSKYTSIFLNSVVKLLAYKKKVNGQESFATPS